jgi:hypothetical protein
MGDGCHQTTIFLPVTGVFDLHEEYVTGDGNGEP